MPDQGQDRAAVAREALQRKFLDQARGDQRLAKVLRRDFYRRLQAKSVRKRRHAKADRLAAELDALARHGVPVTTEAELEATLRELGSLRKGTETL
jgi:hypothetical protein